MFVEKMMFGAKCDNCGEEWDNGDCVGYYTDLQDTRYSMQESGWHITDDKPPKTYCRDCHGIGDDDEIFIIESPKS